jgi:hypothetical protein
MENYKISVVKSLIEFQMAQICHERNKRSIEP